MISVHEALKLVLERAQPLAPALTPLSDARGRVLAESVMSDIDSPPHDKSIVDGYAVMAAEIGRPGAELTVIEEVTAGKIPAKVVTAGTATRIMTGAPIPAGADAVVMIEQTELAGYRVRIRQALVRSGQNIVRRGASLARGQEVLTPGKLLRAIEVGLLAEVGRVSVLTTPRPRVAVLATGNELVRSEEVPGPGQIRDSNGPLLEGLVKQAGGWHQPLGIARDELLSLSANVGEGLAADVLVLSGGVSAGVLDLVPQVLIQLGVTQVFHKVDLKPGKPLWFGIKTHGNSRQTLVFGLPGNPVSGLVCFELFVRPAIEKLSGREPRGLARVTARLAKEHKQRGDRPTYWPAVLSERGDNSNVTPLSWQGSGDLRTLADANCLGFFPAGEKIFAPGEEVAVLLLPES